jgi:hypothetical protein
MTVTVIDSNRTNTDTTEPIRIVSLYPNPAGPQMNAMVWSSNNNVGAEIAVLDVYGFKRYSIRKTLFQGFNVTNIPTGILSAGPYTLRVTTIFGVKTRRFFKL